MRFLTNLLTLFTRTRKRTVAVTVATTVITLATPFIGQWEGKSNVAYQDIVGVWTICYGSTHVVKPGDQMTDQQCVNLLQTEITRFAVEVDNLVIPPMKPEVHAAFTSLAYNVGISAFAKSTALKKLNSGDTVGACNELAKWVYAGGRKVRGLERRREAERTLCLKGAA